MPSGTAGGGNHWPNHWPGIVIAVTSLDNSLKKLVADAVRIEPVHGEFVNPRKNGPARAVL
jgi:hypothetical protein